MPTLPNMGLITPTLGGDPGVWDDKINAMCGLVDAHDHTAGKGVRITPAAININADLAFGGNGAIGLGKAAFTTVTALTSGATTLFVNTADGELYWRTAGGTNVKLTAGNSINTSLVGGIVGDYTAVSAQVYYDDAGGRYKFLQRSPGLGWAVLASGEVRIYETGTTETVYIGQQAPPALAASYAVVWPLALPGGTVPLVVHSDGTMAFGFAANESITLSGTGSYKHGTKSTSHSIHASLAKVYAGGSVSTSNTTIGFTMPNNAGVRYPIPPVPQNARIVNVTLYFDSAANRNDCTVTIDQTSAADPATNTFSATGLTLTPSGTALSKVTGCNLTATAGRQYWLNISNSLTTPTCVNVVVDWDVP